MLKPETKKQLVKTPIHALLVIVSCTAAPRDPVERPQPTDLRPIESVPGLAQEKPEGAVRDCRLSSFVRSRFAGQHVIACGAVTDASGSRAWERVGRCLGAAVRERLPFVAEHQEQGTDSDFRVATVGALEGKDYVVYRLFSDSDPCGGACRLQGGTSVQRCVDLLSAKGGCNGADCAGCGEWVPDGRCEYTATKPETVEDVLGPPD